MNFLLESTKDEREFDVYKKFICKFSLKWWNLQNSYWE